MSTSQATLFGGYDAGAVLSDDGLYRYLLWRDWDSFRPPVTWIMLNPSTADAEQDDPTIRRCMAFARDWGYGGIKVYNVFAHRSTDPRALAHVTDPFGPENRTYLGEALTSSPRVVAAWGAHPGATEAFRDCLVGMGFRCLRLDVLGLTKDGHPRHPLCVRGDAQLRGWSPL